MTEGKWRMTELVEKHDMVELQETFYQKHGRRFVIFATIPEYLDPKAAIL